MLVDAYIDSEDRENCISGYVGRGVGYPTCKQDIIFVAGERVFCKHVL